MKRTILAATAVLLAFGTFTWLGGCQSTRHTIAAVEKDRVIACRLCYDEAVRVRRAYVGKSPAHRFKTIRKHKCPDCKTEVMSYAEDGVAKIKCERCVPEGIACDRCLPPEQR